MQQITALQACPGPWRSEDDDPELGEQARPNIWDVNGSLVAAVATRVHVDPGADVTDPDTLAVGRFIAAAPRLYAALLTALEYLGDDQTDDSPEARYTREVIRAALSAANG